MFSLQKKTLLKMMVDLNVPNGAIDSYKSTKDHTIPHKHSHYLPTTNIYIYVYTHISISIYTYIT